MSSETFQLYRHSGKFGIQGPALALVVAVVAGFPLGFAYSYCIKWLPIVYLNFLGTLGYGMLFGWVSGRLMKWGRVRNSGVAAMTGLTVGLIVLYFAWSAHVNATFDGAPAFCTPGMIANAMSYLYENGSWGLRHSGPLTGIPLAVVWLGEAGIIVGLATTVCLGVVKNLPYCETNQCWLDEEKKIDTLEPFTDPGQLAALKAGDLGPLTQAKPRVPGAGEWTRLTLKHSPRCQLFHTVRLQDVRTTVDKNGEPKEEVKDLTGDLILPAEMMELIMKFERFMGAPGQVT